VHGAANRISLRVPGWVDRRQRSSRLDEATIEPDWIGNRIVVDALTPGQILTVEFPLRTETTPVYNGLNGRGGRKGIERWTAQFRGGTLVRLGERGEDPGGQQLDWYRIFRRERYQIESAPTRPLDDCVAPKAIAW
jgi:hypothetical protein